MDDSGFEHAPAVHTSFVHGSASTHDVHAAPPAPQVAATVPGWHDVPFQQPVQQSIAWQTPDAQAVPSASPTWPHVSAASSQLSVVHALRSSQGEPVPVHVPVALHASVRVQKRPSLQKSPAGANGCVQTPVARVHVSTVQSFASVQSVHAPPPTPHAVAVPGAWQSAPSQQPVQQRIAWHVPAAPVPLVHAEPSAPAHGASVSKFTTSGR